MTPVSPGDRVVVAAGPWPERIGAHGTIVDGPALYPFHAIPPHEVVVLLDLDPLGCCGHDPTWTCIYCRRDLEKEGET